MSSRFERHDIVFDRRAAVAVHRLRGQVQRDRLIVVEPGIGEAAQRAEIDMRLVERVVPGDQARQHSGIRRVRLPADHGQADARHRTHAEAPQHRDMAVSATNEHQVLDDRGLAVLDGFSRFAGD